MSSTVADSALNTRMDTSPMEMTRSSLERRSIAPGPAATKTTSRMPSMSGSTHADSTRWSLGSRIVSTIAMTTAAAIGQRDSPATRAISPVSRASGCVPRLSEDRDWIERRPRAADDPQGSSDEQKVPALGRFAVRHHLLGLEVVEQVHPHGVDGEHVQWERHRSVVPGAVSLLPSDPRAAILRSARNNPAVGCSPRLRLAGVPRSELGKPPRMPGADEQDVAAPALTSCSRSAASRVSRHTWSPGSTHRTRPACGTSSRTSRPTSPSLRMRSPPRAPRGVNDRSGFPSKNEPSKATREMRRSLCPSLW
jgi:hypothetical protein